MSRVVKPLPVAQDHTEHPDYLDGIPVDAQYIEDHKQLLVGRLISDENWHTFTVLSVEPHKSGGWILELRDKRNGKTFKEANLDTYTALVTREAYDAYRKAIQKQGVQA